MKGGTRPQRVAELIKQEIASMLTRGLKDPRLGFVSVMDVRMSPDLRYASVYVSLFGSDSERKSSLIALQRSAGYVRRELGKVLRLRYTPEVRFLQDDTLDRVYELEEMFQRLHDSETPAPGVPVDAAGMVARLRDTGPALVLSHTSPDGDSIGSTLAMARLLRALGAPAVYAGSADGVPRVYRFLPGSGEMLTEHDAPPAFDTCVLVDTAHLRRAGALGKWVSETHRLLTIDHHQLHEPEGEAYYIDCGFAAAAEMVYTLWREAGEPIDHDTALCLYVGQSTDTGCYRFGNTNKRSHEIAAHLLECGIDTGPVCSQIFDVMSPAKVELLRRVLNRLERLAEGQVAHTYLTRADLREVEASREDADGLVNYARNIEGVKAGVLFTETADDETKVSLRAQCADFNVASFAERFGGGGHAAAAGLTLEEPLDAVREKVLHALTEAVEAGA